MKLNRTNSPIFKIVADGGLSSPHLGEGRLVPLLIIDVLEHCEVTELIKLHETTPPGDTEMNWIKPLSSFFKTKTLILEIEFKKPMEVKFGIEFNIEKQYALIDGVIQSRGAYLQTGKAGDKVSEFKGSSILIEVPDLKIDDKWNEIVFETVKDRNKKAGATKKDAGNLARQQIKSMREVWNIRRPNE